MDMKSRFPYTAYKKTEINGVDDTSGAAALVSDISISSSIFSIVDDDDDDDGDMEADDGDFDDDDVENARVPPIPPP